MAYATVEELRAYLKQAPAGATTDALMEEILTRVTDIVNKALGFSFAGYTAPAEEQPIRAIVGPYLYLPPHKLGSVTSVKTLGGIDLAGQWEAEDQRLYAIDANGYVWDWATDRDALAADPSRQVYPYHPYGSYGYNSSLARRLRRIVYLVTAEWGYGEPPEAIKEVVLEVAVNKWRSKDSGSFSDVVGVQSGGAVAVGYERAFTNQQKLIIDRVREQYAAEPPLGLVLP